MNTISAKNQKILLLGASGYVGGVLWADLSSRHSVVGTCATQTIPGLLKLDLLDEVALSRLARQGFDLIIHAAGLVDLQQAESNPELAYSLNVRSVEVLLDSLEGMDTRIIYLSTDNVFDGKKKEYTEADGTSPLNIYGRNKVAAENLLRSSRHQVLRIPIVYGKSPFSGRFFARFKGNKTPAQTDIVCAPLYLPSLPSALEKLWDFSGIVHLGGEEVMTRYELMSRIRDALNLPTEIIPVRNAELSSGHLRPMRLVLRSARHAVMGPSLDAALADMMGQS